MYFAVDVPPFNEYADARYLAELAHDAEQAGWDGFFIWDHMATPWDDWIVDPWVALAAIAMRTERIKIGPVVTPIPRRRPWKLARETASLDRLSGGRLILGVGLGYHPVEFENFGEPFDTKVRAGMLDEGLEVLTSLWSGEPFAFEGEHYRVKAGNFGPPPVQQPRIPIWVAGNWPHAKAPFRRAARWDGVYPIKVEDDEIKPISPQDLADMVAYIREHRTSDEPFDVVLAGETTGDPEQDAGIVRPYAEAGLTWWVETVNPGRWGSWAPPWPLEEMRERIRKGPPKL